MDHIFKKTEVHGTGFVRNSGAAPCHANGERMLSTNFLIKLFQKGGSKPIPVVPFPFRERTDPGPASASDYKRVRIKWDSEPVPLSPLELSPLKLSPVVPFPSRVLFRLIHAMMTAIINANPRYPMVA